MLTVGTEQSPPCPQSSATAQGLACSSEMEQALARAARLRASSWTTLLVAEGARSACTPLPDQTDTTNLMAGHTCCIPAVRGFCTWVITGRHAHRWWHCANESSGHTLLSHWLQQGMQDPHSADPARLILDPHCSTACTPQPRQGQDLVIYTIVHASLICRCGCPPAATCTATH